LGRTTACSTDSEPVDRFLGSKLIDTRGEKLVQSMRCSRRCKGSAMEARWEEMSSHFGRDAAIYMLYYTE
jgi:hypothetical protein